MKNNCHLLMKIETNFPIDHNDEIFYGPLLLKEKDDYAYVVDFDYYENDFSDDHKTIYLRAFGPNNIGPFTPDNNFLATGETLDPDDFTGETLDPDDFDLNTITSVEVMQLHFAKETSDNLFTFPIKAENCMIREYTDDGNFIDHFIDSSVLSKVWLEEARSKILELFNLN